MQFKKLTVVIIETYGLSAGFTDWPIQRCLEDHMHNMREKNPKSCVREPLIKIEPQNCPPDILHMKKAIITKMLNQIVDWVLLQGKEEELLNQMRQNKIPFRF